MIIIKSLEKFGTNIEGKINDNSSLGEWYRLFREKRLNQLSDEDLPKAIRQSLFLPYIIPLALARLKRFPAAGYLYDGELLNALSLVPISFWQSHDATRALVVDFIRYLKKVLPLRHEWTYESDEPDFYKSLATLEANLREGVGH